MSASTAIGMVSESLRRLLSNNITTTATVSLLAPDESGTGTSRINLFLYKIKENSDFKNMDWQVKRGAPGQLVPPPLSLNLFYLMTVYAPSDTATGHMTAHGILGDAMRVFYENPSLPQDILDATGLQDAGEQIKIMLNTLDLEELSNVWSTFSEPFRLSVPYEVSVVQLDMLSSHERAMARRVSQVGIPDIGAPFNPPTVENVEPISGAAGSTLTFNGTNLTGWRAYVSVMRRSVTEAEELTGDSFTVTIPADLPLGFHEILVDISHLFRRTFFFEVTV